MTYQNGWIDNQTGDLPCEQPCPPPEATTNVLRKVMLRWLGEAQVPAHCVLCTPSKSIEETWVMAALFPTNKEVVKDSWECRANPEARLQRYQSRRIQKREPRRL